MDKWITKPTGNMTLSVLTSNGVQIVKVDMLSYNTMEADTNGDILARTINNLTVISSFPEICKININKVCTPHIEAGISPLPWSISYVETKRSLVIKDRDKKKIAERVFPKSIEDSSVEEIVMVLREGCNC